MKMIERAAQGIAVESPQRSEDLERKARPLPALPSGCAQKIRKNLFLHKLKHFGIISSGYFYEINSALIGTYI